MTSIDDISDLAQILRDNPQWREIIRSILLADELLQLPGQLAEFIQTTQQNFQLVYERLDRIEDDVAGLKEGQARLETDVAGLKEGQARLETDVTSLKEGQARLETDVTSLKEGQARLETDVTSLKEGQARLETDVSSLKEGQARLETDVTSLKEGQTRLSSQLSNLIGSDYERQAARLARRRLRQHLNVLDAELLYSITAPDRTDIPALMDRAAADGIVTHEEADDLEQADLILRGQSPEGEDVYVLAEISVTVDRNDVDRAGRRAEVLGRAAGAAAHAVVIGESASPEDLELAVRENVAFLQVAGRRPE